MMRSGSTVQYQIVAEIVAVSGRGIALGYATADRFERLVREHRDDPRHLVVKTHSFLPDVPRLIANQNARAIYSFRDIRDVMASLAAMEGVPYNSVRMRGLLYAILNQYENWIIQPGILVSRYETMVTNLAGEVERIAAYLGIPLDIDEIARIAAKFDLTEQRKRLPSLDVGEDPNSLLHGNHIRRGDQGGWRHTLPTWQVAEIEHVARHFMSETGYVASTDATLRLAVAIERRITQKLGGLIQVFSDPPLSRTDP